MSAPRRTASKREAAAPSRRATGNGPRPAAAAPAPAVASTRPSAERPPRPPERGRATTAEEGAVGRRLGGLRRLYGDTVAEMKKINWPDRETTKNLTIVVVGISAALGILLGGIDFLLQALFEAF